MTVRCTPSHTTLYSIMRFLTSLIAWSAASCVAGVHLKIDPMKHSVVTVTRSDFDAVISKFRDRQIAAIFYYKPDESDSSKFFEAFNQVAAELRGMFKLAAVNCADQAKLCKDEGVAADSQFPVVMVYPIRPLPAEPLPHADLEKLGDEKGLKRTLYRMLPSEHVKSLNEDSVEGFLTVEEDLPKVILLSNKKAVPPLFKAISTEFGKEMAFGFFPSPSESILKRFKVKASDLPKLVIQESSHQGKKRVTVYDGELTYQGIHEWANVRRETFARGGGFDHTANEGAPQSAPPARPWLSQEIPEMYKQSHKDVCFRHEDGLCVIFLTEGDATDAQIALMKNVKRAKSGETVKFRFAWMNLEKETGFKELFAPESMPNVVVFNPHKRLRYAGPLDEPADEAKVANLVDKIVAGEGRFKVVAGQQLPAFADRKTTEEVKEEL